MFVPSTKRVALLVRVRLASVSIAVASVAVALTRIVFAPPPKVTIPTVSLRGVRVLSWSLVKFRPTVGTVALGAVLVNVMAEASLRRLVSVGTPVLSMLMPPPFMMAMAPTLPKLEETTPEVSAPLASASWAPFTVSVPVKGLLAVLSVNVLAKAVPVTVSAPLPVIWPE